MKNCEHKIIFYFKKLYVWYPLNIRVSRIFLKDEHAEQIKRKEVIVEDTNIEIGEKEKEIEEIKAKLVCEIFSIAPHYLLSTKALVEERLSKNQNLLTSLRSSMGEKVKLTILSRSFLI